MRRSRKVYLRERMKCWREKRFLNGLCQECNEPVFQDRTRCKKHLLMQAANSLKYRNKVIKSGDRVRYELPNGIIAFYGEVTIVREKEAKVIPDGDYDWNYDYYPLEQLIKMDDEEKK